MVIPATPARSRWREKFEALAKQQRRQHRAEHRDKMNERAGAVVPISPMRAIEEQIAKPATEDADEGEARHAFRIEQRRCGRWRSPRPHPE